MTAAGTVGRILALVPWLIERPGASVAEAAEAFGVDRATILSDLDTVGYCGLPGLGGGDLFEITVIEDRILVEMADELRRPLRPTPQEALLLLLAGEAVEAAVEVPALRSALNKIRSAVGVPAEVAVQLDEDGTSWLGPVREAISRRRRMRLVYRSRREESPSERVVEPRLLHVAHGHWYVQATALPEEEERTFRLDRITDAELLEEPSTKRDPHPLPPVYEPGPDDVEVELLLAPDARWVAERVRPSLVEELEAGRLRVVFLTDALPWVGSLVLSAAPGARIVRPEGLREDVRNEVRLAIAAYEALPTDVSA
jgi:proteasome accessory factor C